jgi:hypothetical protein
LTPSIVGNPFYQDRVTSILSTIFPLPKLSAIDQVLLIVARPGVVFKHLTTLLSLDLSVEPKVRHIKNPHSFADIHNHPIIRA